MTAEVQHRSKCDAFAMGMNFVIVFRHYFSILYFGFYICSYMKGRDTVHEIQDFLDRIIIKCFTMKYLLLPKRREAVPSGDMDKWNLYKSQEEYFAGTIFILTNIMKIKILCD